MWHIDLFGMMCRSSLEADQAHLTAVRFNVFLEALPNQPVRIVALPKIIPTMVVCILITILLGGCATYHPQPLNETLFRERAISQTENGVRVSAAVLSEEATQSVFGLSLYKKGIQPIWLEIENHTGHRIWFAPVSIDRDYFSPLEVAYINHPGHTKTAKQNMDRFFYQHAMNKRINSKSVRSGFVFTNLELGTKAFNVEVIGQDQQLRKFTFLVPVAGFEVDYREVDFDSLFAKDEKVNLGSPHALKRIIEVLPCCTTSEDGARYADPINVVIIGKGIDILYALLRSGWDETAAASSYDPLSQLPWEFRYQPVLSLYLYNRAQDAAFRKSRSTLNQRNQLRLWLSPYTYNDQHVWFGQISRIVRRLAVEKFKIEPDVDEARDYLLQDLWYAQGLSRYGYVRLSEIATLSDPRKGLFNDEYFTDGLCLVAWVSGELIPLHEVQFEQWEKPVVERKKVILDY
jgi:hypothetical protein